MKTLGPFILLLIVTLVTGDASADLSKSETEEMILQRELEMLEDNLFGKEVAYASEENRNSREKRCMGYDIECNDRLPCCAHKRLECVETSGYWWYKRKYCRPKKG